jgi:adenylate kinase
MAISQRLFTTATGEQSQAVAIFTTIILTTTFTPIKNALQAYVDRNFKEAPGNLKELKELNKQVNQIVETLDHKSLAQRAVETIVQAHNAHGAALFLRTGTKMTFVYATPNWVWSESEVSILLADSDGIYGRVLLGERRDRDDYTLDEIEEVRVTTLPLVRNMQRLALFNASA